MKPRKLQNNESISLALTDILIIENKGYHVKNRCQTIEEAREAANSIDKIVYNDTIVFVLTRNLKNALIKTMSLKRMLRKNKKFEKLISYE